VYASFVAFSGFQRSLSANGRRWCNRCVSRCRRLRELLRGWRFLPVFAYAVKLRWPDGKVFCPRGEQGAAHQHRNLSMVSADSSAL